MGLGTHFAYHMEHCLMMGLITLLDCCNTNFIHGWLLSMKETVVFDSIQKQQKTKINILDYNSQWDLAPIPNM